MPAYKAWAAYVLTLVPVLLGRLTAAMTSSWQWRKWRLIALFSVVLALLGHANATSLPAQAVFESDPLRMSARFAFVPS